MDAIHAVLQTLSQLSAAKETGTLFITTSENRACHMILEQGRVTALSYGRHRGEQVVGLLTAMPVERFSFKQGTKMPLAGRSFVDESYDAIAVLGLDEAAEEAPETVAVRPKRVYRGQVIEEEVVAVEQDEQAKIKKPARMYRGQPLQDD